MKIGYSETQENIMSLIEYLKTRRSKIYQTHNAIIYDREINLEAIEFDETFIKTKLENISVGVSAMNLSIERRRPR